MKNSTPILFVCMTIALLTLASGEEGICFRQEIADITPSSVKVNEDFTVGIQIQGCGNIPASDMTLELKSINSDIIVKENLLTEIENICTTCKKHLIYNMRTSNDATPGEYNIQTKLSYKSPSGTTNIKEKNFTINIISNYAELNIASLKVEPIFPKKGEPTTITVRIENFGKGEANSVKGKLNFGKTTEAFLGKLDPGEDGPLVFTIIPKKAGEINYSLDIMYSDDYGSHKISEDLTLSVEKSGWGWGTYTLITIAILAIIYFFLKKKGENGKTATRELY